jgi:hypothetical protein
MRTATSPEDGLLVKTDCAARRLGNSRSRLLSGNPRPLNRVYAGERSPEERQTVPGMQLRLRSTIHESWQA